jgi:hypothetical protein
LVIFQFGVPIYMTNACITLSLVFPGPFQVWYYGAKTLKTVFAIRNNPVFIPADLKNPSKILDQS